MKIVLWLVAFLFLIGATLAGIGASVGVLDSKWFALCLFCIAGMFSAAEWADNWENDNA